MFLDYVISGYIRSISSKKNKLQIGVLIAVFVGQMVGPVAMTAVKVSYPFTLINSGIATLIGVGSSFIMIAILMIIVFASIRTGLISMIPNLAPVLLIGAVMGYSHMPLL